MKIKAVKLPCKNCGKEADAVVTLTNSGAMEDPRGWQCKHCGLTEILEYGTTTEKSMPLL